MPDEVIIIPQKRPPGRPPKIVQPQLEAATPAPMAPVEVPKRSRSEIQREAEMEAGRKSLLRR